ARAVAAQRPEGFVLSADTVVALGRRILPKGETEEQARACLALLSGRRHRVLTGVALIAPGGREKTACVASVVRFKRLSQAEAEADIATRDWQGKAGAYAIQGPAAAFIPFISGSYSGIVGLPLCE